MFFRKDEVVDFYETNGIVGVKGSEIKSGGEE